MRKSRKLLPRPSGDISLTKYGYKLHLKRNSKIRALRRASKKYGALPVLRHLNLIRNISKKGSVTKKKLGKDVKLMSRLYKQLKK